MNASMFFALLAAIYLSPRISNKMAGALGISCIVLQVIALLVGVFRAGGNI